MDNEVHFYPVLVVCKHRTAALTDLQPRCVKTDIVPLLHELSNTARVMIGENAQKRLFLRNCTFSKG